MTRLSEHTFELIQELHARRGFLERLRGQKRQTDALTRIGLSGELAAVPHVAPFLADSSIVAATAANTIGRLLENATPENILFLDEGIRRAFDWPVPDRWRQLKPGPLSHLSVEDSCRAPVFGVLSCHPNGYIREAALKRLAQLHDGSETPYLLIRLNDWVAPVRQAAKKAVMQRFQRQQFSGFLKNLFLVLRLTECCRDDHANVVQSVINELVKPDGHIAIAAALSSPSRLIRRQSYRLSMMTPGSHRLRVVHLGLTSDDVVLRLWSARDARNELPDDELENSLKWLQRDYSMPVRREALIATIERFTDRAHHALTEALLDRSVSVRDFARFLLKKEGEQDFATFYREAIQSEHELATAIAGLGETGNAQDVDTLKPFLQSPESSVRHFAIRSVGALAGDRETETFLELVKDGSGKVSFEACQALKRRCHLIAFDELMSIFRTEVRRRTLRAIVDLLDDAGSWTGIPFLLEAAVNPNEHVSNLARQRILARINRVFTRPNATDQSNIIASLERFGCQLPAEFVEEFRSWMHAIHPLSCDTRTTNRESMR